MNHDEIIHHLIWFVKRTRARLYGHLIKISLTDNKYKSTIQQISHNYLLRFEWCEDERPIFRCHKITKLAIGNSTFHTVLLRGKT